MIIAANYLIWWYSQGLIILLKYLKSFLIMLTDTFSIRIVLFTFFKPWKKDATPTGGLSIDQKLRIIIFNLISIGFGMVIKSSVFLTYIILLIILIAINIILFILWLIAPILIIEFFVLGIMYLIR